MKKLMEKEAPKMSMHEKDAKISVLQHLKKVAEDMMKDHMGGMKKVSVMSDSPEGLAEGLDKAKELASHADQIEGDPLNDESNEDLKATIPTHDEHNAEGSDQEEAEESPEEASEEGDDMSHEELDAKIKHLMELKKRKMMSK